MHDDGDFLEAAELLVGADELLELVGVDDDVQHADLRQPELLVLDAARVDLFPVRVEFALRAASTAA